MAKPAKTISFPASSFGDVMKTYRKNLGLNQGALADLLHVNKNSVYNWENNKCKPDANMVLQLCSVLHVPVQELLGVQNNAPSSLTGDEDVILSNYRAMSPKAKGLAKQMMISMAEEDARQQGRELRNGYYVLGLLNTRAAAGSGCPFIDDTDMTHRFVKVNKLSSKADALVRVSGRSMEPVYHDGDMLLIAHADSGDEGDDLICSSMDGVIVKRKGADGRLYSVNSELPYGEKYEDDNVRVMGKVLGIAHEDDIATGQLVPILEDLLADEVSEFEKERRY